MPLTNTTKCGSINFMMKNFNNITTLPIIWNPTHGLRPKRRIFSNQIIGKAMKKDVKKFVKMIDSTSLNGVTIGGKSHYKVKWEMKDTDGNIQTFTYTLARSPSDNNWAKVAKGRVNRMIRQKNVNVKY